MKDERVKSKKKKKKKSKNIKKKKKKKEERNKIEIGVCESGWNLRGIQIWQRIAETCGSLGIQI